MSIHAQPDSSGGQAGGYRRMQDERGLSFGRTFTLLLAAFFLVQAVLAVGIAVWVVGGEMSALQRERIERELEGHRHALELYLGDRLALLREYAGMGRIRDAAQDMAGADAGAFLETLPMLGDEAAFCLQSASGAPVAAPPEFAGRLPGGRDLARLLSSDDAWAVEALRASDGGPDFWRLSVAVAGREKPAGVLSAFLPIVPCSFPPIPGDGAMSVSIVLGGRAVITAGTEPRSGTTLMVATRFPGIELAQKVGQAALDRRIARVLCVLVASQVLVLLLLTAGARVAGRRLLIIPHARLQAMSEDMERDMARRTAALERQATQLSMEIRERREAEAEARETGQLVTALLEGVNASLHIVHPASGRIIRANTVVQSMFGLAPWQTLNRDCRDVFAEAGAALDLLCPACVDGGKYAEGVARHADGTAFPVARYLVELEIRGEAHIGVITLNISERKTLERRLNIAQKLESVGALASGIAHEINTPIQYVGDSVRFVNNAFADLSAIVAAGRELLDACRKEGFHPELVGRIGDLAEEADLDFVMAEAPKSCARALEGVERVAVIVRAMKNFAHPGDGNKKGVDINHSLANTVTVAKNEWKYVADVVEDYGDIPIVSCLAGDINQVFLNIIVNAAHAIADVVGNSGKKGTITLSTRLENGMVVVRIADTGTGIPPGNRDKIFDPFFTTKEVGRGTGQGLAIVHDIIVERHRGSIDVETEVGRGTTFIIALPPEG
ncbi:MAG: ATP-binding protein [Pseudodesulfovibrio sp.]